MACAATNCAACRETTGCGWSGAACGVAGNGFNEQCSDARAGALLSPAPPMRDDPAGMARLGMVGYVDPYAGLKTVPAAAVTYGPFRNHYETHMTGATMQTCLPTLQFGDTVGVFAGAKALRRHSDGTVTFEAGMTPVLLRPPPGSDRLGPIRYGDQVVLTTGLTAQDACGVYGCGVGRVVNGRLEMGPGGATGGTPLTLEAPPGYEGNISYGGPVFLAARLPPTGRVLRVGDALRPGKALESPSSTYRLVYNTDGTAGVYSTDDRTIWVYGKAHTAGRLVLTHGALVAYQANGIPAWNVQVHGRGPYTLGLTDTGILQLKGRESVLWSSPADPQPMVAGDAPHVVGRLQRGRLVFGSREGTRFTLDTRPGKRCDLDAVAKLCGAACPGFVYAEADATWQPLTSNPSAYRHADTLQQVWLKEAAVALDASCPSGAAEVVPDFGTPTGVVQTCGPPTTTVLPAAYEASLVAGKAAAAQLSAAVKQLRPTLHEMRTVRRDENPTTKQQALDWQVMNASYMSQAVLWCLLAGVGMAVVLLVRRNAR